MVQLLPAKLNVNGFIRWIDRDHETLFMEPPRIDKRILLSFRVKRLKFTVTTKRRIIPPQRDQSANFIQKGIRML